MKHKPSPAFDYLPWPLSPAQIEKTLNIVESSFAAGRQRAEQLTRELMAGTITPERWNDAVRGAYTDAWQSYAACWNIMSGQPVAAESHDDADEKDES